VEDLLLFLVKSLASEPSEVTISKTVEPDSLEIYNINVSPPDRGLVIGKGGSTIRSIRNLAKVKAVKDKTRVRIQLIDEVQIDESPFA